MRVTTEHLTMLREAVAPLDTPERRARYIARDIPRADLVQDIDKRYRWDLFHAADPRSVLLATFYDRGGYHDAHIDTALRAVVPPLDA
jgi:hypothetical protein